MRPEAVALFDRVKKSVAGLSRALDEVAGCLVRCGDIIEADTTAADITILNKTENLARVTEKLTLLAAELNVGPGIGDNGELGLAHDLNNCVHEFFHQIPDELIGAE